MQQMTFSLDNNDTIYEDLPSPVYELSPLAKFWSFLVFDVLAVFCSIFVIYHLLVERRAREAIHNHATIIILILTFIYQIIDIPLHLMVFWTGVVIPAVPALCLIWWYIDWCFYYLIAILLMFISFERHILIFHSHLVSTKRKRYIFHYIPLISLTLFLLIYYVIVIFAPICENTYDYNADGCGAFACYSSVPSLFMFEQVFLSTVPSFLIVIVNVLLLIRVIRQKYRMHRSARWKKQRKLALQIFLMSAPYFIFSLPLTLVYVVHLCGLPDWGNQVLPIFIYLSYLVIFILPFVCLAGLPELWYKANQVNPIINGS